MSFFENLIKKKDQSVIGVDIGSSSIKVVQLRKKAGKAVLETYGELALGPYAGVEIGRATNLSNDKIVDALRDLLKESNVTSNSSGLSIAAASSLLSFIKMPDTDPKQLAIMVPIEARKYIPVPITEVALDWWPIPKEENSFSEFEKAPVPGQTPPQKMIDILLVVIHNDVLARLNSISQSVGLKPSFFEIEIFSTMRSVLDQSLAPQMVFDMGSGSTKLYIVERGVVKSSHTINRGSQDITLAMSRSLGMAIGEAEHMKRTIGLSSDPEHKGMKEVISLNLDYIFAETNRVVANYHQKSGRAISKIVLVGGGSLLKGLLDIARVRFQTEVVLGDPFSKTEAPAFLDPVLKTAGPEFAVAIGIALRKLQEAE